MSIIILIWAAVWLLPFLLTRTFTSVLPSMPTFIVVAGCGFLILMFLTNITLLILANVYSNYELRTRLTLDTTFYLLDTHWDSNGNLIRVPNINENTHVKEWIHLPLPLERKHWLIQAGIPAAQALTSETQKLTTEDLHVAIVLHGRTPFPLTQRLDGEIEYA